VKDQKFGIEIEMTGITRKMAAEVLENYFGRTATHSHSYDSYSVKDEQNRIWKIMYDASITPQRNRGSENSDKYKVEMVSPICTYDDIPKIQELVRNFRSARASINSSCGIHVHVDASRHDATTIRNITNIMASKEDLIFKALNVNRTRESQYCRKVNETFLRQLNSRRPRTREEIQGLWYQGRDRSWEHYHPTRYHALNLHSTWNKGTIEFRLFNGSLHAGEIKTYIQFSLAVSHQAMKQRHASHSKTTSTNEKYTFRTWLLRLGLIGEEFKTARGHLLKNLDGCIAWKNPEDAIKQREAIKQKRLDQQEQNQDQSDEQDEGLSISM
jgi:hypothetical protein